MLRKTLKNFLEELLKNQQDHTYEVKLNYQDAIEELRELDSIVNSQTLIYESLNPVKSICPTCGRKI